MARINTSTLKQLRKQAGLTQKQAAQAAGVSYSTLTKLEQGAINAPSITLVTDVAAALGCSADDLLEQPPLSLQANQDLEFIYFDVGGVLVHTMSKVLHLFAERIHRPENAVFAIFYEHMDIGGRGKMTIEELKLLMLLRLDVSLSAQERNEILAKPWIDDMEPITSTHALIHSLLEHHRIGLLTNIFPGFYPDFFDRGLVPDLPYSAVIRSCDVGLVKPEPQIFELAAEQAQTEPHKILFIDDSRVNVQAARRQGWQAELFDEHQPQVSIQRIVNKWFRK